MNPIVLDAGDLAEAYWARRWGGGLARCAAQFAALVRVPGPDGLVFLPANGRGTTLELREVTAGGARRLARTAGEDVVTYLPDPCAPYAVLTAPYNRSALAVVRRRFVTAADAIDLPRSPEERVEWAAFVGAQEGVALGGTSIVRTPSGHLVDRAEVLAALAAPWQAVGRHLTVVPEAA